MTPEQERALRGPYTHTFATGGIGLVGCLGIFLFPIGVGVIREAYLKLPLPFAIATALAFLALFAAIYAFFSDEVVTTVDAQGLRCTRQRVVGPFRGAKVVELDVRFEKLSSAALVHVKRPSKNGGWNEHQELRFGNQGTLGLGQLGGVVDGVDPFQEIAKRLALHLGDRFSTQQDLGPLDDALKQLVDAEVAKRTQGTQGTEPPSDRG